MFPNNLELIHLLEQMAANIWPAPNQQSYEHWLLREGNGVTMRANSVLTSGSFPMNLNWFEEISDFYTRQKLPIRFHISAATDRKVDHFLENKGFIVQSPTSVYIADSNEVLSHFDEQGLPLEIEINQSLNNNWMQDFISLEQHPMERKSAYVQIFSGISLQSCYLRIYENGVVVGLGTAVIENNWAGFGNIITSLNHRNKGIGARIVHELTLWSSLNGANQLYLQVMRDNKAALGLYTKLGFTHTFNYHYRIKV
jgi:GNAT superfamily N-acetyltransferase